MRARFNTACTVDHLRQMQRLAAKMERLRNQIPNRYMSERLEWAKESLIEAINYGRES